MNEKILVVDDEKELADLVEVYLKNDGYTVYKFYNGKDALKCIESVELDLAILDIMLPDVDGFQICQKIREKFYFPVIMLTAKVEDGDKIMGQIHDKVVFPLLCKLSVRFSFRQGMPYGIDFPFSRSQLRRQPNIVGILIHQSIDPPVDLLKIF